VVLEDIQRHGTVTGRWSGNTGRITNTVYPIKYMVVTGELTTGFVFYGPFDSLSKAGQWATYNLKDGLPHRVHSIFDVRGGK
jgi:hypothetical protein